MAYQQKCILRVIQRVPVFIRTDRVNGVYIIDLHEEPEFIRYYSMMLGGTSHRFGFLYDEWLEEGEAMTLQFCELEKFIRLEYTLGSIIPLFRLLPSDLMGVLCSFLIHT